MYGNLKKDQLVDISKYTGEVVEKPVQDLFDQIEVIKRFLIYKGIMKDEQEFQDFYQSLLVMKKLIGDEN